MTERETEFREMGSQTEFGNQKKREDHSRRLFFTVSPCHLVTLSLLFSGCNWPGKPKDTDRPIPAEEITDFGILYGTHCAGCHGADGKDGPAPPLYDPLFLAIVPDEVLRQVITEGRTGTPMTAFAKDRGGPLTEKQIDIVARGIKQRWPAAEKVNGKAPLPYLLSAAKAGDKKAGMEVFARDCAMCHGKHGQGGDDAGAINDPAFLALVSDQVLRRYIITGRPDFGMPDYVKREDADLTSQEINDLVALLAYWRVGGSVNGK
jgi:cytochrome c oxidase cbb3-type subunit 3/ubiquinol-cytochrome c reductase cytochrome c subunit